MLVESLLVATGGVAGALLRWKSGVLAAKYGLVPQTTVLINAAGSFVLGSTVQLVQGGAMSSKAALLIGTGFCGSFTTLSAFSVDIVTFVESGLYGRAFLLFSATNLLGFSVRSLNTDYKLIDFDTSTLPTTVISLT